MNHKQEQLQFLGIYGIFRETIKLIFTGRRIFSQIALTFILPLSFSIFTPKSHELTDFFPLQWRNNTLLSNFACFFFSTVFFFLSTSAAVYAAASNYADRHVSIYQVIGVVPKICKQHLVTFLCVIVDFLTFNIFALSAIALICMTIPLLLNYEQYESLPQLLILILSIEAWYFALIWQISSAVSVFEADSYGFEAIARSKELLKGKMAMATILLILIGFPFGAIVLVFRHLVVESALVRLGSRGILGIIWIWSFLMFSLIGIELYLVCKSYHREGVDKSALSAHLQGFLPMDCESLKVEDDDELEKSLV